MQVYRGIGLMQVYGGWIDAGVLGGGWIDAGVQGDWTDAGVQGTGLMQVYRGLD